MTLYGIGTASLLLSDRSQLDGCTHDGLNGSRSSFPRFRSSVSERIIPHVTLVACGMPATPDELEQIRNYGEMLRDDHMADSLIRMYEREAELLDTEIGEDQEMREITVHNMAVLAGAAARILVRSAKPKEPR